MIVKFRFRDTKWGIMQSRKMLKGTGITFSEDLNSEMQKLLFTGRCIPQGLPLLAGPGMAKYRPRMVQVRSIPFIMGKNGDTSL